jgi:hypothetical protein
MEVQKEHFRGHLRLFIKCQCGAKIQITSAQAGSTLTCPSCQETIIVPTLSELQSSTTWDAIRDDELCPICLKQYRRRKPFQYSIRTIFLVIIGVAVLFSLGIEIAQFYKKHKEFNPEPLDRSWHTGTLSVQSNVKNGKIYALVDANWPDANPNWYVRYGIWFVNDKGDNFLVIGSSCPLENFTHVGARANSNPPPIRVPYRVVCDYEIWDDIPEKGRLLTKSSVFSDWYK